MNIISVYTKKRAMQILMKMVSVGVLPVKNHTGYVLADKIKKAARRRLRSSLVCRCFTNGDYGEGQRVNQNIYLQRMS